MDPTSDGEADTSFACGMCGKCFADAEQCSAHIQSHTGQKPFKCVVCWPLFYDMSATLPTGPASQGSAPPQGPAPQSSTPQSTSQPQSSAPQSSSQPQSSAPQSTAPQDPAPTVVQPDTASEEVDTQKSSSAVTAQLQAESPPQVAPASAEVTPCPPEVSSLIGKEASPSPKTASPSSKDTLLSAKNTPPSPKTASSPKDNLKPTKDSSPILHNALSGDRPVTQKASVVEVIAEAGVAGKGSSQDKSTAKPKKASASKSARSGSGKRSKTPVGDKGSSVADKVQSSANPGALEPETAAPAEPGGGEATAQTSVKGRPSRARRTGSAGKGKTVSCPSNVERTALSTPGNLETGTGVSTPSNVKRGKAGATHGNTEKKKVVSKPINVEKGTAVSTPGNMEQGKAVSKPIKLKINMKKGKAVSTSFNVESGISVSTPGNVEKEKIVSTFGNVEKRKVVSKPGNVEKEKVVSAPGNTEKGKVASTSGNMEKGKIASTPGNVEKEKVVSTSDNAEKGKVVSTPGNVEKEKVVSTPDNTEKGKVVSTPDNTEKEKITSTSGNTENGKVVSTPGIVETGKAVSKAPQGMAPGVVAARKVSPGPTAKRKASPGPTAKRKASPGPTATRKASPGPTATTRKASPGPTATRKASPGPTATTRKASPGPTATTRKASPGPTATRKASPGPTATGVSHSPAPGVSTRHRTSSMTAGAAGDSSSSDAGDSSMPEAGLDSPGDSSTPEAGLVNTGTSYEPTVSHSLARGVSTRQKRPSVSVDKRQCSTGTGVATEQNSHAVGVDKRQESPAAGVSPREKSPAVESDDRRVSPRKTSKSSVGTAGAVTIADKFDSPVAGGSIRSTGANSCVIHKQVLPRTETGPVSVAAEKNFGQPPRANKHSGRAIIVITPYKGVYTVNNNRNEKDSTDKSSAGQVTVKAKISGAAHNPTADTARPLTAPRDPSSASDVQPEPADKDSSSSNQNPNAVSTPSHEAESTQTSWDQGEDSSSADTPSAAGERQVYRGRRQKRKPKRLADALFPPYTVGRQPEKEAIYNDHIYSKTNLNVDNAGRSAGAAAASGVQSSGVKDSLGRQRVVLVGVESPQKLKMNPPFKTYSRTPGAKGTREDNDDATLEALAAGRISTQELIAMTKGVDTTSTVNFQNVISFLKNVQVNNSPSALQPGNRTSSPAPTPQTANEANSAQQGNKKSSPAPTPQGGMEASKGADAADPPPRPVAVVGGQRTVQEVIVIADDNDQVQADEAGAPVSQGTVAVHHDKPHIGVSHGTIKGGASSRKLLFSDRPSQEESVCGAPRKKAKLAAKKAAAAEGAKKTAASEGAKKAAASEGAKKAAASEDVAAQAEKSVSQADTRKPEVVNPAVLTRHKVPLHARNLCLGRGEAEMSPDVMYIDTDDLIGTSSQAGLNHPAGSLPRSVQTEIVIVSPPTSSLSTDTSSAPATSSSLQPGSNSCVSSSPGAPRSSLLVPKGTTIKTVTEELPKIDHPSTASPRGARVIRVVASALPAPEAVQSSPQLAALSGPDGSEQQTDTNLPGPDGSEQQTDTNLPGPDGSEQQTDTNLSGPDGSVRSMTKQTDASLPPPGGQAETPSPSGGPGRRSPRKVPRDTADTAAKSPSRQSLRQVIKENVSQLPASASISGAASPSKIDTIKVSTVTAKHRADASPCRGNNMISKKTMAQSMETVSPGHATVAMETAAHGVEPVLHPSPSKVTKKTAVQRLESSPCPRHTSPRTPRKGAEHPVAAGSPVARDLTQVVSIDRVPRVTLARMDSFLAEELLAGKSVSIVSDKNCEDSPLRLGVDAPLVDIVAETDRSWYDERDSSVTDSDATLLFGDTSPEREARSSPVQARSSPRRSAHSPVKCPRSAVSVSSPACEQRRNQSVSSPTREQRRNQSVSSPTREQRRNQASDAGNPPTPISVEETGGRKTSSVSGAPNENHAVASSSQDVQSSPDSSRPQEARESPAKLQKERDVELSPTIASEGTGSDSAAQDEGQISSAVSPPDDGDHPPTSHSSPKKAGRTLSETSTVVLDNSLRIQASNNTHRKRKKRKPRVSADRHMVVFPDLDFDLHELFTPKHKLRKRERGAESDPTADSTFDLPITFEEEEEEMEENPDVVYAMKDFCQSLELMSTPRTSFNTNRSVAPSSGGETVQLPELNKSRRTRRGWTEWARKTSSARKSKRSASPSATVTSSSPLVKTTEAPNNNNVGQDNDSMVVGGTVPANDSQGNSPLPKPKAAAGRKVHTAFSLKLRAKKALARRSPLKLKPRGTPGRPPGRRSAGSSSKATPPEAPPPLIFTPSVAESVKRAERKRKSLLHLHPNPDLETTTARMAETIATTVLSEIEPEPTNVSPPTPAAHHRGLVKRLKTVSKRRVQTNTRNTLLPPPPIPSSPPSGGGFGMGRFSQYQCELCDARFKLYVNFLRHQKNHGKDRFVCDQCGVSFGRNESLKMHKMLHTGQLTQTCSVCGKTLSTPQSLTTHMRIHTGERPYACPHPHCPKTFRQQPALVSHFRTHTKERPFQCETCGKRYRFHKNLYNHRFTHTGERRYVCTICNASYYQVGALNIHVRIHSGQRPFACPHCRMSFTQKSHLAKHLRHIHGQIQDRKPRNPNDTPDSPLHIPGEKPYPHGVNGEKPYQRDRKGEKADRVCGVGEKPFPRGIDLDKPYSCDHCYRRFTSNFARQRHTKHFCSVVQAHAANAALG